MLRQRTVAGEVQAPNHAKLGSTIGGLKIEARLRRATASTTSVVASRGPHAALPSSMTKVQSGLDRHRTGLLQHWGKLEDFMGRTALTTPPATVTDLDSKRLRSAQRIIGGRA